MKSYRRNFKGYLADLAKKIPAPGGGSAICLSFCLGVSLIEKAINYSLNKEKKLSRYLNKLRDLKAKIYPFIDLDGKLFEQILGAKGKKKEYFLKQSENIIIDTAQACLRLFSLAKQVEFGIKKSIISDFHIGGEFVKLALKGCVLNLEANRKIFGKSNKYIKKFKSYL